MVIRANLAEQAESKYYYVITRETLASKSIYNQFTTKTTVDEIINTNVSKAPQEAKSCRWCKPNAMQMQRERIIGALALKKEILLFVFARRLLKDNRNRDTHSPLWLIALPPAQVTLPTFRKHARPAHFAAETR